MRQFITWAFSIFLFVEIGFGQDTLVNREFDDVIISATRIDVDYLSSGVSVNKSDDLQLTGRQLQSAQELLLNVPGIFSSNQFNSAQDLRVSIRGFGARSAFGIRGVRLLMDGIPMTTPDGQGQVDNLILGGLKSIEVLNGASSALYGNASGGVIAFNTFSENDEKHEFAQAMFGSFGNYQVNVTDYSEIKGWDNEVQALYQDSKGFRANSRSVNFGLNSRWKRSFSDSSTLSIIGNLLISPQGQDPGGITFEQAIESPVSARDRNIEYDAGEDITQVTAAFKYLRPINEMTSVKVTGYFTRRNFSNHLPFEFGGQVDLGRNFGGTIAEYKRDFTLQNWKGNLLAGFELAFQRDLRERYKNLEGMRGDLTLDQIEIFNNQAAFALIAIDNSQFFINAGLRLDNNQIIVQDRFLANGEQDGRLSLPNLSPSLALSHRLRDYHFIRLAFNYAFETPTLNELSNRPDDMGGFNPDLRPQASFNYEVGFRSRWSENISSDITLFTINSQNELLPYEVDEFPGRTFYRNAGKTRRNGIESSIKWSILPQLELMSSYTFSDFMFTEYEDFEGNQIPGIPRHHFTAQINFSIGRYSSVFQHRYVSSLFADNANGTEVASYHYSSAFLNARLGRLIFSGGVNNLFDSFYFDNIRINAFGGRFYEPGAPRNFYLGVKFEF